MSQITAKRYALALYQIVNSSKNIESINSQISGLIHLFENEASLGEVLSSPIIQSIDKEELVKQIFEKKIDGLLMNFILFLINKRRIDLSQNIFTEYQAIIDSKNGKIKSQVVSVVELNKNQLDEIKKFLQKNFSKNIELSNIVDKSLQGGYQIKVGDLIIDQSLRNHVQKLKARLLAG